MMKILLSIFLAQLCGAASARYEEPLPNLFERSDAVCLGRSISQSQVRPRTLDARGKLSGADWELVMDVRFCYKGEAPAGRLTLFLPGVVEQAGPVISAPELLFLKARSDGAFALTDSASPILLADVPLSTEATHGLAQLEGDLVRIAVRSESPTESRRALELLAKFPKLSDRSVQELTPRRSGWDADRALIRLVLLANSEPDLMLSELASAIEGRRPPERIPCMETIGDLLSDRTTQAHISVLKRMAVVPFPGLRADAMAGLRRIRDVSTIPFLIEQLEASDPLVAYRALITLAEMTGRGGDYGPSMPRFLENPENYKQLWRRWWVEDGNGQAVR